MDHLWLCQIEGDQEVSLRATTAVEAARRYVAGGDWSPEEDGWTGTGVLSVRVMYIATAGRSGSSRRVVPSRFSTT